MADNPFADGSDDDVRGHGSRDSAEAPNPFAAPAPASFAAQRVTPSSPAKANPFASPATANPFSGGGDRNPFDNGGDSDSEGPAQRSTGMPPKTTAQQLVDDASAQQDEGSDDKKKKKKDKPKKPPPPPPQPGDRVKNWPKCRPMVHHDIAGEIPEGQKQLVRRHYIMFYLYLIMYFYNMLVQIWAISTGSGSGEGIALGIAYFIVCPPMMFFFIYMPFYNAVRQNKARGIYFYFVTMAVNIALQCLWLIGIGKFGSSGVIQAINFFAVGGAPATAGGVACIILDLLWVLLVIFNIFLYKKVHSYYVARAHAMEHDDPQAMARGAATAAAKNPAVQKAAKDAAVAAAKDPKVRKAATDAALDRV